MRSWDRPSVGIAALVATATMALAGCGGPSSPVVASLHPGRGPHGGAATTAVGSDPTELLDAWASCMRKHGDAGQVDPSIDVHKVIHIAWDPSVPGGYYGTDKGGHGDAGPGQYCRSYLDAAQNALRGGRQPAQPSPADLAEFSQCMRANGVPDFPDPDASGSLSINVGAGGDLSPRNPTFQHASTLCSQKTGVPGFGAATPPPGTIALDGSGVAAG